MARFGVLGSQLASEGSFAEAAGFGDTVVNATSGSASLDALTARRLGEPRRGKVLIDVGVAGNAHLNVKVVVGE